MPNLIWFRRDLRLYDNPALYHACQHAQNGCIALFVMTPVTWKNHAISAVQIDFLLQNLQTLSEELIKLNIPLIIREVPTFNAIPDLIAQLKAELKIEKIFSNRQYELDERKRDRCVAEKIGDGFIQFDDQVMVAPPNILNQQGEPFKVFTPFKKKWFAIVGEKDLMPTPKPKAQKKLLIKSDAIPTTLNGFSHTISKKYLPEAGEKSALKKLKKFCANHLNIYHQLRDFPSEDSTSHLSPFLALGVLSPRQCLAEVIISQEVKNFSELTEKNGPGIWVSELIWREFYKMIMFWYPQVCRYQPFQMHTTKLKWNNNEIHFQKWCQGQTGFPLVDAAMRQLNETGWMHNRLRMLTAMFLSKLLFIDWRLGERYFSEHLIDLDFSANNGGWQWCASTGTDASPYFRIFNPITQSKRFDIKGDFIRQFCPELAKVAPPMIHDPYAHGLSSKEIHYPNKMIDYATMRARTLMAFKKLRDHD